MKLLVTTIKNDEFDSDLSLRYLYSVVDKSPINVDWKTYDKFLADEEIYSDIINGKYNIIYFYSDEMNDYRISAVSELIKKSVPSTAVVVGGPSASFDTYNYMKSHDYVDYAIRGEGELVFFNFIKSLVSYNFDFENIKGLAYRNGEDIIINKYEDPIEMEELPFPYDRTDLPKGIVYYETTRGTSDSSNFIQVLPDSSLRSLSLSRVCTELRYLLVREVDRVIFTDNFFNHNIERAYRIFEYLINNDNGHTVFEMNIDGDNLDEETIRLLTEARKGLFIFNIDVASTNAATLDAIGRRENIYQLMYNVTKLLTSTKVEVVISIIIGLPYDTEALFARSFNKAYGLADGALLKVKPMVLHDFTKLMRMADKYGYIYMSRSPHNVIATDYMPAPDMIKIKSIAKVVDKYRGQKGFTKVIDRILNDTATKPYEFFDKLNDYIFVNEIGNLMSNKADLFRVLNAFAIGLYNEDDDSKLSNFKNLIKAEVEANLTTEEFENFERKGWDIEL